MTSIKMSVKQPKRCVVCDAAPIDTSAEVCSVECARAARHVCQFCGTLTLDPEAHFEAKHPDQTRPAVLLSASEGLQRADPEMKPLEPQGPVSYGEQTETPGSKITGRLDWECDDCGTTMSKSYARTFATDNGELYCPDCRSRSERYTRERY